MIEFNGLSGNSLDRLIDSGMDPRCLRPYVGNDGHHYVDRINANGKEVAVRLTGNTTATLRKEDWITFDRVLQETAKERLMAQADLRARGLQFIIPDGMGSTVLQTETVSDLNDAVVSMDGLNASANDREVYESTNLPLPIIHKDFSFSARQIAVSRKSGTPLDTRMIAAATRKVAESVEKLLLGRLSTFVFGGGTVYGYTNYTSRLTKVLTNPTASAWTGTTLLNELLAMRKQLTDIFRFGPFMIYAAPAWDQYIDNDFKANSDKSLRNRIAEVGNFEGMKTLDYLQNYDIVMVQMTSDIIRTVIGMDMTAVQWDTDGGMKKNFKIMTIQVPQLRADQNSSPGIVHASTA